MSVMSVVQALSQIGNMAGVVDDKTAKKIDSRASLLETNGSITRLLSSTVVEPIIIVSENAYNSEKVEGAINLSLDLFSSYYLQAFKILTTLSGLNSTEAIRVLSTKAGAINDWGNIPKNLQSVKQTAQTLYKGYMAAIDQNVDKIDKVFGMFKEDYVADLFNTATDLFGNNITVENFSINTEGKKDNNNSGSISGHSGSYYKYKDKDGNVYEKTKNENGITMQTERGGLTLEKFFIKELELRMDFTVNNASESDILREKKTLIMPITIRSIVFKTSIEGVLSLCKPFSTQKQLSSRWDDFKSGSISLMNLLFCGDLIEEYKKERLRTNSDLNQLVNSRIGQSVTKLATQGARGFEANYNMLVLSTDDVNKINKYIRGDLFKDKYKEEVLEQAHAIAATVLDDDYERMSLLIRDNYGVSTVSYKKISDKTTNQYDAIIEMMHALSAGRNLQF